MKGCASWRDAVVDSALGVVQDAALAAHIQGCPGCAEALRESQAAAVRMDAALGRRATVEPPRYGVWTGAICRGHTSGGDGHWGDARWR
jgi:hypothetical protein